jgi:hypothetical protein
MKTYLVPVVLLLALAASYGQQTADVQGTADFCRYTQEQARAQQDLLRTPNALVGPIQPSAGTPPQMVVGVQESLMSLWKSHLTGKLANATCDLYQNTTAAQMHILYAMPGIEKVVLYHRLDLIQAASDQLDGLIQENGKYVDAHNLTKPALYTLQGAKVRLDMSRTETLTGLTTPYVPKLSSTPLRELVGTKMKSEGAFQKANVRVEKQASWDIKLEGGEHTQLSQVAPGTSSTGAYGMFSLTYSFGGRAANKHFDKSVTAYTDWKTNQFDDVSEQSRILRQQVMDTIKIQQDQLAILLTHDGQIDDNLTSIAGVDSAAALTFKTQLLADKIVLEVDVKDVQFRIATLQEYLAANF